MLFFRFSRFRTVEYALTLVLLVQFVYFTFYSLDFSSYKIQNKLFVLIRTRSGS